VSDLAKRMRAGEPCHGNDSCRVKEAASGCLCAQVADEIEALSRENEELRVVLDGNRPLPLDRDKLGRLVREAWIRWAGTQPSPKPSWLVPYDEISEPDKEADRQIGEAIARWTLIHDAARAALTKAEEMKG